jgi:iron complex outermembrane recepter protein
MLKCQFFWMGLAPLFWALPAMAQEVSPTTPTSPQPQDLRSLPRPAMTVSEWQTQIAQAQVRVTQVTVTPSPSGLEIRLDTADNRPLLVDASKFRREGNAFVADLANATLALPSRQPFAAADPTPDITSVQVSETTPGTLQVRVTGNNAPPKTDITLKVGALAYALNPAQVNEDQEVVVTGARPGYNVPNASVGTRTDTPLRDIPQSIQVIPRQLLEDRGSTSFNDALRSAGVTPAAGGRIDIRGFRATDNILTNGSRNDRGGAFTIQGAGTTNLDLEDIEQIEVLRGPASVLYGSGQPGGTINITTRQPSRDPSYRLQFRAGSFDFYRPSIDFTGPLSPDKRITYRLNAFYENSGSFVDFVSNQSFGITPVLRFELGSNTVLTLDGTYRRENGIPRPSLPARGTALRNPLGEISRSLFIGEPDFDRRQFTEYAIGYRLEHKINPNWSIKNSFRFNSLLTTERTAAFDGLSADNQTLLRTFVESREAQENYNAQASINGKVRTGWLQHDLLFGVEYNRGTESFRNPLRGSAAPLNIFNPVYGDLSGLTDLTPNFDATDTGSSVGIYGQNLISFGKKVKLLLGGRYDWSFLSGRDNITGETFRDDPVGAFSPRIGLVYQPIQPVSLYANWSRSFLPSFGTDRLGNPFKPVTGQQLEAGVKAEFLNGRVSTTLAAYRIVRQNDLVPDPVDPDNFEVQVGEIRSRGLEFDLSGEILPGLKLIATYALTDSKITADTSSTLVGARTINVPLHSGSLWAVYEVQRGRLQGLGIGSGVFVVGAREGNFPGARFGGEQFTLAPYARVDSLLYYRRKNWKLQVNVENLLNANYVESSFGSDVLVGAPVTVRGTFSFTF